MNDLKVASWMLGLCEEERVHPQVNYTAVIVVVVAIAVVAAVIVVVV